jgi:hypothetical protein
MKNNVIEAGDDRIEEEGGKRCMHAGTYRHSKAGDISRREGRST